MPANDPARPEVTADHVPANDTHNQTADTSSPDSNRTSFHAPTDDARPDTDTRGQTDESVPGFVVLGELGRGGMGVVYKAKQVKLNRVVALKMVLRGAQVSRSDLIRFLAEAEAVATVKHANVVQVYDYGEANGRPYMALEFLPGGSLAGLLAKGRESVSSTSASRDVARLLAQIARGVAAAHAQGIVHRDLKPANVLLDEVGVPKVADFGLAKRGDGSEVTQTGQVMGTPAYMSPEQAKGETKFVGPQADVWALGVIMYEALAEQRPFTGTVQEILAKLQNAEPLAPRKAVSTVPRDLELICLKCLSKAPHERYPTAKELADDLDRFLRGEPISVRPAGSIERAVKWARRKPTLAAAYGLTAVSVLLFGLSAGAVSLWQRAEGASEQLAEKNKETEQARDQLAVKNKETAQARDAAVVAQQEAEKDRTAAVVAKMMANTQKAAAVAAQKAAEEATGRAEAATARVAKLEYAGAVSLAYQDYLKGHLVLARRRLDLCPDALRGWEWRYVHRLCNAELYVRELKGLFPERGAFSPGGKFLARIVRGSVGQPVELFIHETDSGKIHSQTKMALTGGSNYGLSADGKRIAIPNNRTELDVHDTATGKVEVTLKGHTKTIIAAAFSHDGSRVATGDEGGTVKVWNAETGKEVTTYAGHAGDRVYAITFRQDGARVATGGFKAIHVWDTANGEKTNEYPQVPNWQLNLAFDTAGKSLVTIGSYGAQVHSLDRKVPARSLTGPPRGGLSGASISPDGKLLASGGADGLVWVWDLTVQAEPITLRGHTEAIWGASFTADGSKLASVDLKGWMRGWNPREPIESRSVKRPGPAGSLLAITPDGKRAMIGFVNNTTIVRDTYTGETLATLAGEATETLTGAFSADGKWVATSTKDNKVRVHDAATGQLRSTYTAQRAYSELAFSPDGARLASSAGGTTVICAVDTGAVLHRLEQPGRALAFSATGDRLRMWTGDADETKVIEWTPATNTVQTLASTSALRGAADITTDGRRALVGPQDRGPTMEVRAWADGALVSNLIGHTRSLNASRFSPDGSRVLSAATDSTVRLWDAETGSSLITFDEPSEVRTVLFLPAEDAIVTWSTDGTLTIRSAKPIPKVTGPRLPRIR